MDKITDKLEKIDLDKISDNVSTCSEMATANYAGAFAKIKPPVFKGEATEKPLHFISDLKKYVHAYKNSRNNNIKTLITQCLTKYAKTWVI